MKILAIWWKNYCEFMKAFQGPVMCDIEHDMELDRKKGNNEKDNI